MSESRRELLTCRRPPRARGPHADELPNVVLTTHDYARVLFYDDLLMDGRTVLVNFMSIAGEADRQVTANLARVQPHLGEHLGREVFFYSISTDPADTPDALRAFAAANGARPGWLFLTGEAADVELLRGRLFVHAGPHPAAGGAVKDCSAGLCRYGNESIGLWGGCPAISNPEWIARRLSWMMPRTPRPAPHRRRGPLPDTWRS